MVRSVSFLNKPFSLLKSPKISPYFTKVFWFLHEYLQEYARGYCSLKSQASTTAVQGSCTGKGHNFACTLQSQMSATWHYPVVKKEPFCCCVEMPGGEKRPYWDKQIHEAQKVDKWLELFGRPGKHQCSHPKCCFPVLGTRAGLGYSGWFIYLSGFLIQNLSLRARTQYALCSCCDFRNLNLLLCYPVWLLELTAPKFHRLTSTVRAKSV